MYINEPVKSYLKDLSARKPTPGGGSAAALTGAVAAGLLSMVIAYSDSGKPEVASAAGKIAGIRKKLSGLVDKDIKAYKKVIELRRKMRAAGKKTKGGREKIAKALKDATAIPLEIAEDAYCGLEISVNLIKSANMNLISDTLSAAILFAASFEAARQNVKINLKSYTDKKQKAAIIKKLEQRTRSLRQIRKKITQAADNIL